MLATSLLTPSGRLPSQFLTLDAVTIQRLRSGRTSYLIYIRLKFRSARGL